MGKNTPKNKARKLLVRTGDMVAVVAGNDVDARGKVLRAMPAANKVIVENVNVRYVHEKAGRGGRRQGERTEKEMPVDASNVMLICRNRDCERYDRPVRVRKQKEKDGSKSRLCVRCGHAVGSD